VKKKSLTRSKDRIKRFTPPFILEIAGKAIRRLIISSEPSRGWFIYFQESRKSEFVKARKLCALTKEEPPT
jgi:hypothetical protein